MKEGRLYQFMYSGDADAECDTGEVCDEILSILGLAGLDLSTVKFGYDICLDTQDIACMKIDYFRFSEVTSETQEIASKILEGLIKFAKESEASCNYIEIRFMCKYIEEQKMLGFDALACVGNYGFEEFIKDEYYINLRKALN